MFGGPHEQAAQRLIRLALDEDLARGGDVTTLALLSPGQTGAVEIVARAEGVFAGLSVARAVFDEIDPAVQFVPRAADGDRLRAGQTIAELSGKVQSLLIGERTCLNFLTRLCGVATLTRRFVDAVAGTKAAI